MIDGRAKQLQHLPCQYNSIKQNVIGQAQFLKKISNFTLAREINVNFVKTPFNGNIQRSTTKGFSYFSLYVIVMHTTLAQNENKIKGVHAQRKVFSVCSTVREQAACKFTH